MWWARLFTFAAGLLWLVAGLMLFHESRQPVVFGRYSADYAALVALVAGAALLCTIVRWPPVYRRLPRLRIVPALPLLMPVIIGVGAAELLVRSLDLFGASYYGEIARFSADTLPDAELNYRLRPGLRDDYQGVPVELNDMGLRERPLGPKRPGRTRVLLLGDSVTFGWGVPVDVTFGRQLEGLLPVETVNSGVPSYNSDVELGFLKRHGGTIDPDAVLLLFVENDTDPTLEPPPRDIGSLRRFRTHPSESIQHLLHKSRIYSMLAHFVPLFVPLSGGERGEVSMTDAPGWKSAMTSLARIAAWCRARGIPFSIFLYRTTANPRTDAQAVSIARLADQEGFGFEDVLPWFQGHDPRAMAVSLVDSHPNAEGHRILAEGMAAHLTGSGALRRAEANGDRDEAR